MSSFFDLLFVAFVVVVLLCSSALFCFLLGQVLFALADDLNEETP